MVGAGGIGVELGKAVAVGASVADGVQALPANENSRHNRVAFLKEREILETRLAIAIFIVPPFQIIWER
jgi:hypothetical protein